MNLPEVDRVTATAVVDNYIDGLRGDEPVSRRFSRAIAGRMTDFRAAHGLTHLVEVGPRRRIRIGFRCAGRSARERPARWTRDGGHVIMRTFDGKP